MHELADRAGVLQRDVPRILDADNLGTTLEQLHLLARALGKRIALKLTG